MNRSVWILSAAVAVAAIVASHLVFELRREREQAVVLDARVAALEPARGEEGGNAPLSADDASPIPSTDVNAVAASGSAARTTPPVAPVPTSAEGRRAQELIESVPSLANMRQTPAGRDMARSMASVVMSQLYPDIQEALRLTDPEAQKLMTVMARQQEEMGVEAMSLLGGGPQDATSRQDLMRKMAEMEEAQDAELKALLGSKYAAFEEYQARSGARVQVQQLQTALSGTTTPLQDTQFDALISAFAVEQSRMQREESEWMARAKTSASPDMMAESMRRTIESQRRLIDAATPHLDAAQIDHFRRQVEQQINMLRATSGLMGIKP